MLIAILKFIFAFLGISSTLLFVAAMISAVNNPQIVLDDKGNAVEKNRNMRVWLGLLTALFWALLIAIL
jgi:hypothetical protein